tara:strand:- start:14264 stop:14491 length:228 start_codon:yes stop_codon:yes gene_type:complete
MSDNRIDFKSFKIKKENEIFDLMFENFQKNISDIDLEKDFMKYVTLEEETIKQANNIDFNKLINLQLKKVKDFYE